ncbi:MAG TPA: hypothetical protein VIF14_16705 [Alphaproteobacteria bacterium]|jgi:hypothetical protein
MDWYLIGRILGVVFWPALVAVLVYGLGWALSIPRQPHVAVVIKRWSTLAAVLGFVVTLFFTGRDFLRYAGAIT